ncbi:hypothetical protein FACS189493_5870 [Spirochaetia bacterium]|nr:hypothetical protein FACS189493_5870 [Spirochaetia bacterium]
MIAAQIGEGDKYEAIKKAITILITDFVLITDSGQYHNGYVLYDPRSGSTFTDIIEVHTLELPKVPQKPDSSNLWNWLQFFNAKNEEEYMTLTKKNPRIGKAVVILKELSEDERTRLLAEDREKAWKDQQGRIDFAVMKTKIETAKKALSKGLSLELIQDLTGLKAEEIVALKND